VLLAVDLVVLDGHEPPWTWLAFAAGAVVGGAAMVVRRGRCRARLARSAGRSAPAAGLAQGDAAPLVPTVLPPPPLPFVGRDRYVEAVEQALRRPGAGRPVVVISGDAGIGKSALALHVAHRVAGCYRDGQLFGQLTAPATASWGKAEQLAVSETETVLRSFVSTLQKTGEQPAADFSDCSRVYDRLTAKRAMLVVLDDVPAGADITALLPTGESCAVLVTTRDERPNVEAALTVGLRPLQPQEGVRLLSDLLGPDRVTTEQQDAALTIVESSGALPLALRLAGTSLAARPSWSLPLVVELLERERQQAGLAPAGDDTAFDLAYLLLPQMQRRALGLLGLCESADFEPWMLKALLRDPDVDDGAAGRIADRLCVAGMVERSSDDLSGMPGFRVLDRVWAYAVQRARASADLAPGEARAFVAKEKERRDRLDPFRLLRSDVCQSMAAGELSDAMTRAKEVLSLARERDERREIGLALAALAELHSELGNMGEAEEFAEQAIANPSPDARVRGLRCRAVRSRRLRQLANAEDDLDLALGMVPDDDAGERVRLLRDLAWVKALQRDTAAGARIVEQARVLCTERLRNGQRQLPGVLSSSAAVHREAGDLRAARRDLAEAALVAERNDLHLWRAWIDQALGRTALQDRDVRAAKEAAQRGGDRFDRMRHRYGRAHCRLLIGECLLAEGDTAAAVAVLDEALETFGNCGDQWAAAHTSSILAEVQARQGRTEDAAMLASAARRAFAELGDRAQETSAQMLLAELGKRATALAPATR